MLTKEQFLFLKGTSNCVAIDNPQDIEKYCIPERGTERGKTTLILMPRTTQAVSDVMAYCYQHQIQVVPQGGMTGLAGGSIPDASGNQIILNLSLLNEMLSITENHATAQAGMILSVFKDQVAAQARYFPLSYGSEHSAQLGGAIATNSGGLISCNMGARQLALQLKVVLTDGKVMTLGNTVPKDNSGYDIKDLFIGSEGTLGIITEVTFKLFDPPVQNITILIGLSDLTNVPGLFKQLRRGMAHSLSAFELIDQRAFILGRTAYEADHGELSLLEQNYPWYVLIECTTSSPVLNLNELFMQTIELEHSVIQFADVLIAETLEKSHALWSCRHRISDAAKQYPGITFDISAEDMKAFIDAFTAGLTSLNGGFSPVIFGHAGDYNLHVHARRMDNNTLLSVEEKDAIESLVLSILLAMRKRGIGVSISAEHGIGRHKKQLLQSWVDGAYLKQMQAIKSYFDPHGQLHSGVIFDQDAR